MQELNTMIPLAPVLRDDDNSVICARLDTIRNADLQVHKIESYIESHKVFRDDYSSPVETESVGADDDENDATCTDVENNRNGTSGNTGNIKCSEHDVDQILKRNTSSHIFNEVDDVEEEYAENKIEIEHTYNGNAIDEANVRHDQHESNTCSPVDLTASSRYTENGIFMYPVINRGMDVVSCFHNGIAIASRQGINMDPVIPVYRADNQIPAMSTLMTVCNIDKNVPPIDILTMTMHNSTQGNKRGLAFSVKNILDPNMFTGGRIFSSTLHQLHCRGDNALHEGDEPLLQEAVTSKPEEMQNIIQNNIVAEQVADQHSSKMSNVVLFRMNNI